MERLIFDGLKENLNAEREYDFIKILFSFLHYNITLYNNIILINCIFNFKKFLFCMADGMYN